MQADLSNILSFSSASVLLRLLNTQLQQVSSSFTFLLDGVKQVDAHAHLL